MAPKAPVSDNSSARPAKKLPRTPPEERFWKRYSPHGELPLSGVGSLAHLPSAEVKKVENKFEPATAQRFISKNRTQAMDAFVRLDDKARTSFRPRDPDGVQPGKGQAGTGSGGGLGEGKGAGEGSGV